jgi:gliding motility-associated-like protein
MPASVTSNTQTFASNLNAGVTSVTITTPGGCNTSTSFTMSTAVVPTMTLSNNTGSYSLTCVTPSVDMVASSNYTNGTISYFWSSISFTANTPSVSITQTGTYNICAFDAVTSCSTCETFTVFQNTTAPTSTVNPVSQVITCGSSQATFTGTALGPTVNIVHEWYCPQAPPPTGPPSFTSNNVVSPFATACGPGTYTYIIRDITNGCIVTKTVNITSVSGFPTFNTSSTSNYSVGCSPLNQTTLCIVNAVSVNSAAVQFLFLPPGTPSAIPVPTTVFGAQSCTTLATPGQWTLVVQDPSNGCQTALTVPILQNTIAPHILASFSPIVSQTLTCFNPTLLATGTSSTPGTTISWQVPSTPPVIPSSTIILGTPTGPATHTNNLTYATYTCIASNTVNACQTTSFVIVNQNFRIPTPSLAVGNPSVINCNNQPVVLSYTNNAANSGIPGAVGVVTSWMGPAPQTSLSGIAQYSANVAGPYTLTVQDNKNGCYGTKTYTVLENKQPPVLSPVNGTVVLGCAAASVGLVPNIIGGNTNHKFWYRIYPDNAAFSPLSAIVGPMGTSNGTVYVDQPGYYSYVVTNTLTGCKTIGTFSVIGGNLIANFTPNSTSGFAPLTVNFTNNSGSTSTTSITSVWSFGNGVAQTTTTNISPSTTYTAPGTYTVYLTAQQGACFDTAMKVIRVDIPSKLEVPNVFTPNGDGSNDEFFLKIQNVTEITAYIYDRWGNKVYEVSSNTGNIAWDGKSIDGKECAAGTYFYIIKGKGKDGAEYDQKGNVSLYR